MLRGFSDMEILISDGFSQAIVGGNVESFLLPLWGHPLLDIKCLLRGGRGCI